MKSNFSLDNISNNDDGNVPDYKKILNCFFPHLIDISQIKEENENRRQNYLPIKEMMDNLISDEESKKGFKALIRQSYFLGKIRCSIVSIYFI